MCESVLSHFDSPTNSEEYTMSLSIFDRGDGRFDLMRSDAELGWIADRAIGFRGFEDRSAARRAAAVAYEALTGWLARERRIGWAPRKSHTLRVRRDGAVEELTLGDVPVGRLLHHDAEAGGRGSYAFELLLPPRVGAPISAAQVMYHALERHRAVRETENGMALV